MGLTPLVLGHEGTGEIIRLGANVRQDSGGKQVRLGDRIVTSVNACGKCDACLYMPGRLMLGCEIKTGNRGSLISRSSSGGSDRDPLAM